MSRKSKIAEKERNCYLFGVGVFSVHFFVFFLIFLHLVLLLRPVVDGVEDVGLGKVQLLAREVPGVGRVDLFTTGKKIVKIDTGSVKN